MANLTDLPHLGEQEPTAVILGYIHAALGKDSGHLLTMLLRLPVFDLGEVKKRAPEIGFFTLCCDLL